MIWNVDAENATPGSQSLASVGVGLRLALQRDISASLEITKPLTRLVATENGKPVRVFVSISAPF
jgi:hemolysin activation/secretion protein